MILLVLAKCVIIEAKIVGLSAYDSRFFRNMCYIMQQEWLYNPFVGILNKF